MGSKDADDIDAQCGFIAAQRAAVESLEIGRNTLAQAQQQSQQLQRASRVANDTQYQLDQAARLLKNMTWAGWIANKLTREPALKSQPSNEHSMLPSLLDRDDFDDDLSRSPLHSGDPPTSCREAFQAIQNYRANLKVLQECQQADQLDTCESICLVMYKTALQQLQKITEHRYMRHTGSLVSDPKQYEKMDEERSFRLHLETHVQQLRRRQSRILEQQTKRFFPQQSPGQVSLDIAARSKAMPDRVSQSNLPQASSSPVINAQSTTCPSDSYVQQLQKQDDHLEFISTSLDEIGYLSRHLHDTVHASNLTMDQLEEQSDSVMLQTRHVTRRADRLARQKNSSGWFRGVGGSTSLQFMLGKFVLRHAASGLFLSLCPRSGVRLRPDFDTASCLIGLYATRSNAKECKTQAPSTAGLTSQSSPRYGLIGMKNLATNTWMGQSLMGNLDCSATAPGHRQEWELDDGIDIGSLSETSTSDAVVGTARIAGETRLLCASAGWGTGGYLMVGPAPGRIVTTGGSGVDGKNNAAIWLLIMIA